jgi:hypothetical protein
MAKEKITIQIDNEVIELKGAELDAFLEQRKKDQEAQSLIEAEQTKKKEARENAIKKLAEIAGLTDEEINAII